MVKLRSEQMRSEEIRSEHGGRSTEIHGCYRRLLLTGSYTNLHYDSSTFLTQIVSTYLQIPNHLSCFITSNTCRFIYVFYFGCFRFRSGCGTVNHRI